MTLRVAAAQAESTYGEVEANVKTAVDLVERAAQQGARVVVLPELFLTGYAAELWSADACLVDPSDGRLVPLADAARATGAVVVAGAALRAQEKAIISLLAFDERGGITRVYDKQHLTDEEKPFFAPGEGGATIVVDDWSLGLGVCFDGCFPQHAAAAAVAGASAYLCPSAYYVGSEHRRDLYYAARALDNGIYVLFAGLTGRCGARGFNGGSAVYDPEGRPLARVGAESPAVAVADLDADEIARVRAMNPILAGRRDLGECTRWVLPA